MLGWIAIPLTSMLKTSKNIESTIRPGKGGFGVGGGDRAKRDSVDDGATHFDAQDEQINGLIN